MGAEDNFMWPVDDEGRDASGDIYEEFNDFIKKEKYYNSLCVVTHWKQYTMEAGGCVESQMKVREAIWQMQEHWLERATFTPVE
jgi:hypothetical protein